MTQEIKEKLYAEILKHGIAVVFMSIVIYFLYKDKKQTDDDIRAEIKVLRVETKECSKHYQDVLLNQIDENTKVMSKSNELIDQVKVFFKQGRRARI